MMSPLTAKYTAFANIEKWVDYINHMWKPKTIIIVGCFKDVNWQIVAIQSLLFVNSYALSNKS